MKTSRRHDRVIRRLETEFSAEGLKFRGISSDFSLSGLFVRTNNPFKPGTMVDIKIHLPDGRISNLRGKVRRALKTNMSVMKNGMGVEIMERDANYEQFIRELIKDLPSTSEPSAGPEPIKEPVPDFIVISCPSCGVKNKINRLKIGLGPKCGKCGSALS